MISGLLAFLISISVIIIVHELGHYLAARWMGVHVEVFSLGYGKRLFGKKLAGTDFRVSMFPLGGYARMFGDITEDVAAEMVGVTKKETKTEETADLSVKKSTEDEIPEVTIPEEMSFFKKPKWKRIVILVAGSLFNLIFAVILLWFTNILGRQVPEYKSEPPVLGGVVSESPAQKAGLLPGDRIISINNSKMATWEETEIRIIINPNQELTLNILRNGEMKSIKVVPIAVGKNRMGYIGLIRNIPLSIGEVSLGSEAERMGLRRGDVIERIDDMKITSYIQGIEKIAASQGKELSIYILRGAERLILKGVPQTSEDMYDGKIRGKLGFAPVIPVRIKKFGFLEGLDASIKENVRFTKLFFVSISKLITGKLSLRSMSGLPEITKISIDVAKQGAVPFIFLMGFISLNLALFNLIPIPLLDGGAIFIIILEGIRRKDFSLATKERILQVGFIIIIALVIVILYNDAVKLFFS